MSAQIGQKFEIQLSGSSIAYREYTTGGTAQYNYYPLSHVKCVESVVQIGYGTRDTTTNQRKHRVFQNDLLRITISFVDDTKPLSFDIQNVIGRPSWSANAAGVATALAEINSWISGQGSSGTNSLIQELVDQGNGVIDTQFSSPVLPYTVPAGVNSYTIVTQGSVAVDGITVPAGSQFSNSHPSQDGTVLSPDFTDVSGGSIFVTLGIKQ